MSIMSIVSLADRRTISGVAKNPPVVAVKGAYRDTLYHVAFDPEFKRWLYTATIAMPFIVSGNSATEAEAVASVQQDIDRVLNGTATNGAA